MQPPLGYIPDSQGHHYRLQLNAYRYILERYYGEKVAAMWVVCLHPDNDASAFVDRVPVMNEAVVSMMSYQRERAYNCTDMATTDLHDMDPLGGMDLDDDDMDFDAQLELEGGHSR